MDLKQLDYFVTVADVGGFSRAARLLGVAQPALSRQVRSLEVELRQALLLRNGRGVVPTEAGRRLLAHARGIVQQVERARAEVNDLAGAPVGRVVIGLPPTLARVLTAPIVRDFRQRVPDAQVSIVEGLSATIQEWVQVGRVDVGVVYDLHYSPAIELSPLMEEALCLVGPASQRERGAVPLRQLPRYPLIMPARPNAIRMLVEARLAAIGLKPNVTLEIDAIPAILELVGEGFGYAVLSERAVVGAPRLAARAIVRPGIRSRLAIAVSAQRPETPLQRSTIERIRSLTAVILASRAADSRRSRT